MSAAAKVVPAAWYRAYTLADMAVIESLDSETRAVVERYRRLGAVGDDENDEDAYEEGFRDGVREAVEAVEDLRPRGWRRKRRRTA